MSRFALLRGALMRFWMARSVVAIVMLFGSTACASLQPEPSASALPNAEATSIRRTAIAEVQRIIAGNSPVTPTAEPTETPQPGCAGALWWYEARSHIGESRTVQGPVVAARTAPNASIMLTIGQLYPDPTGLAVIVPPGTAASLTGKTVCVAGRITSSGSAGLPTIEVRDVSTIRVVN